MSVSRHQIRLLKTSPISCHLQRKKMPHTPLTQRDNMSHWHQGTNTGRKTTSKTNHLSWWMLEMELESMSASSSQQVFYCLPAPFNSNISQEHTSIESWYQYFSLSLHPCYCVRFQPNNRAWQCFLWTDRCTVSVLSFSLIHGNHVSHCVRCCVWRPRGR